MNGNGRFDPAVLGGRVSDAAHLGLGLLVSLHSPFHIDITEWLVCVMIENRIRYTMRNHGLCIV